MPDLPSIVRVVVFMFVLCVMFYCLCYCCLYYNVLILE